jgi:hypothetical protein
MTLIPIVLDNEINDIDTTNDSYYLIFTTLSISCLFMFVMFSKRIHTLEKQHNL